MKNFRIKNILVPTDFSPISRHAVQHAERIAVAAGARITLLNVVEPLGSAFGTSGMLELSSLMEEKQRRASIKKLEGIARRMGNRFRLKTDTLTATGRIAPEITNAAATTSADLIVMGTHGSTGFVENLLGSNTYRVASISKVPLISVHKSISRSGYSHIIYPVRDPAQGMRKFPYAMLFARLFHAKVHIIGLLATEHDIQERAMRSQCIAIQKRFKSSRIPVEVAYRDTGFLPEVAIRYGHTLPRALVVITQDTDFHLVEVFQGVFSKRVLHRVLSPVLALPKD
jgi:nucleotide-binding universal stress UspA family protein